MPSLARMVTQTEQSGIRRIFNVAHTMKDLIRLEAGEPLFVTPRHIIDAGYKGALDGFTKYTPSSGVQSLREAIAEEYGRSRGLPTSPDQVAVTVGTVGAISCMVRLMTNPGDEVLTPEPGWPNYRLFTTFACAVPVPYVMRAEDGFLPTIAELERRVTPRTKVLIVNSPSNPLGTVFPEQLMADLVQFARAHDLFLISDEVYEKIIYEDAQHVSAAHFDTDGRVVVASGFSKTYAMTGWRVGYCVARPDMVEELGKVQEAYVSCPAGPSQKAAEAALRGSQDCVREMWLSYDQSRRVAKETLDRYGIPYLEPRGAFYVWINVGCADSMELALDLMTKKQVSLAPGIAFGASGEGYVRISLASPSEVVEEGITRLVAYLDERE